MPIHLNSIPDHRARTESRSSVIGHLTWPAKEDFREPDNTFDEGAWADACADLQAEARSQALEALNDHEIDTTEVEIRIAEFDPAEIRAYWPTTLNVIGLPGLDRPVCFLCDGCWLSLNEWYRGAEEACLAEFDPEEIASLKAETTTERVTCARCNARG